MIGQFLVFENGDARGELAPHGRVNSGLLQFLLVRSADHCAELPEVHPKRFVERQDQEAFSGGGRREGVVHEDRPRSEICLDHVPLLVVA